MKWTIAVLLVCSLSGCLAEPQWLRPTRPDEANALDSYECAKDARTFGVGAFGPVGAGKPDQDLFEQCLETKGFVRESRRISWPRTLVLVSVLATAATAGAVAAAVSDANRQQPR